MIPAAHLGAAPDRFAVIADVHGNADALKAVLADIDAAGIAAILNLGDHLSGPLDARGTADLMRARAGMIAIRGNHDRYLLEMPADRMGASDAVAFAQIGVDDLDWLRAMPGAAWLGDDVFLCHGAPRADDVYLLDQVTEGGIVTGRDPAGIAADLQGIGAALILCGHTHTPRAQRLADGRLIVNPGSVGCPAYSDDQPVPHVVQAGSPDARYAVPTRAGGDWDVTFRHIPYDASRMVDMARRAGRPDWARALATGWLTGAD